MALQELDYTVIDSFTDKIFCGNPAAVVHSPAGLKLSAQTLQQIAREFNLSETAFVAKLSDNPDEFSLRWFTPKAEVPLCGHATLASAHALFSSNFLPPNMNLINFETMSGVLTAKKLENGMYELDFPAGETIKADEELEAKVKVILDKAIAEKSSVVYVGVGSGVSFSSYMLVELEISLDLANMNIDPSYFAGLTPSYDVIILTVASKDPSVPIISRVFAPALNITEDPVTGSAHCMLGPYWHKKLNEAEGKSMKAKQVSERGGDLEVLWDAQQGRCKIRGNAIVVASGKMRLPKVDIQHI